MNNDKYYKRPPFWLSVALVLVMLTLTASVADAQQAGANGTECCKLLNLINYQVNSKDGSDPLMWVMQTSRKQNITCYGGRVLYPFGPECADHELSKDLTRSEMIHLNFSLPFMGHRFDRAWVNQHGFISFQESFLGQTLSNDDWPQPKYPYVDDPVFIAPFYAQTDLASDKIEDLQSTKYGRVLYKVIHRTGLPQIFTEEEKFIYQLSMKVLDDAQKEIRDSVSGGEDFVAMHALIATWKSVSFLGSSLTDIDQKKRNTFQATILSDTNYTYVVMNYENIEWYASTSQGGHPETGTGGKAAKIGFNRGNGTLWYGHRPFSENAQLMQSLAKHSNVKVPGRFIFRIDEWIQPGGCNDVSFDTERQLHIWPRYANMLGGQEVNITGPCFENNPWFYCKWGDNIDAPITIGEIPLVNKTASGLRGRCIQPIMYFTGRLNLSISLDGGKNYDWKAEYTVVDPLRYPAKVEMVNMPEWFQREPPPRLIVKWDRFDLSWAESDPVDIELYGYYEDDYGPHWDFLGFIAENKTNKGSYGFDVAPNRARNQELARKYKMGAIAVSLFDSAFIQHNERFNMSKKIWTALHPLGWWRNDEMKFFYDKNSYLFGNSRGKNWAEDQCRWWHQYRRYDLDWMDDLEICPPTLSFAIGDMGVWAPDPSCNMYGHQYNELNCLQHPEAQHCVITMRRTRTGAGNRCCYDKTGNLMYTNDTNSGSTPDRYHSLGMEPYNEYGKVPALSHYFHDIVPFYLCCHWSRLCESYLYLRQTKDAKGYREPRAAVAYGDPHLITFDGKDYTFNGKGEFTLFRSKRFNFRLQARFEQPPNATFCLLSSKGQINATRITAIAAGQDDSDIVEVRARVHPSQSQHFKCDILVNGKTYYFNYTEEKVQIFKNVFVLSPLNDYNMSNITIMFNSSGVGVQVECLYGLMHVRAAAPFSMFKETAGLLGYWDNITANDFMSPDGSTNQLTLKPDLLYQRFGMAWRLKDESESIFSYTGSWNFDTFHDNRPIIREWQRFRPWFTTSEVPFPSNVTFTREQWLEVCDGDEQCLYDAAAMGSLEIGERTRDAHRYYRILHENMASVNSCGIYLLKGGIRKTTKGNYLVGSVMTLSCERGYTLFGWDEFYCNWNGTWLPTNNQWIEQFRDWPYCEHYHITAIRWTSIGLSIIWTLCLLGGVIYHYCIRKQRSQSLNIKGGPVTQSDEEGDFQIPFNEPAPDEVEALRQFSPQNYLKDGYAPPKTPSQLNASMNRSLSQEILNADLVPKDSFEKPAMILQIPRTSENNSTLNRTPGAEADQRSLGKPRLNSTSSSVTGAVISNGSNNASTFNPNMSRIPSTPTQQTPPQPQPNQFRNSPRPPLNMARNPLPEESDLPAGPSRVPTFGNSSQQAADENDPRTLLQQKQFEDPNLLRLKQQRERQQQQALLYQEQLRNQQQRQNAGESDV